MSVGWVGFYCGLIIGTPCGVLILAACLIPRQRDRNIDRMFADVVPPRNANPPRLPR